MLEFVVSSPLPFEQSVKAVGAVSAPTNNAREYQESTSKNYFNSLLNKELSSVGSVSNIGVGAEHNATIDLSAKGVLGQHSEHKPALVLTTGETLSDYLQDLTSIVQQLQGVDGEGKSLPVLNDFAAMLHSIGDELQQLAGQVNATIEAYPSNSEPPAELLALNGLLDEIDNALTTLTASSLTPAVNSAQEIDAAVEVTLDATHNASTQADTEEITLSHADARLALLGADSANNATSLQSSIANSTSAFNAQDGHALQRAIERLQFHLAAAQQLGSELRAQLQLTNADAAQTAANGVSSGLLSSLEANLSGLNRRGNAIAQFSTMVNSALQSPLAVNAALAASAVGDGGTIDTMSIMPQLFNAAQASAQFAESARGGLALANQLGQPPQHTGFAAEADNAAFKSEISLPMNSARWGEQFAQRLSWFVTQGVKSAELQLNPSELGPIHVRIDSSDDAARVVITTQHSATRDVIEQHANRLRGMFDAHGMDLMDVDVSSQQQGDANNSNGDNAQGDQQSSDGSSVASHSAGDHNMATDTLQANSLNRSPSQAIVLNYARVDAYA